MATETEDLTDQLNYARSRLCVSVSVDLEDSGAASDRLIAGATEVVLAQAGTQDSSVEDSALLVVSTAAATDGAGPGAVRQVLAEHADVARSSAHVVYVEDIDEAGRLSDSPTPRQPDPLIVERAEGLSTQHSVLGAEILLGSTGRLADSVGSGKDASVEATAKAWDELELRRYVDGLLSSAGLLSDRQGESARQPDLSIEETATIAASIDGSYRSGVDYWDLGIATDTLFSRDPSLRSLTLQPETGAVSEYVGYDFESIVQVGDTVLAAGADGLYILDADDDDGSPIRSRLDYSGLGFGIPQTKRLDNLYVGHTGGRLRATVAAHDFRAMPAVRELEPRNTPAPRPTRVTLPKGMVGRYWYVTLENVDGSDFWIDDMEVDLAVSTRRI